jgi:hypothetical protein
LAFQCLRRRHQSKWFVSTRLASNFIDLACTLAYAFGRGISRGEVPCRHQELYELQRDAHACRRLPSPAAVR